MNAPIFKRSYGMEQSLESYSCQCSCTCVCNCSCSSSCPGLPPDPTDGSAWHALRESTTAQVRTDTSSNNRWSWYAGPGANVFTNVARP